MDRRCNRPALVYVEKDPKFSSGLEELTPGWTGLSPGHLELSYWCTVMSLKRKSSRISGVYLGIRLSSKVMRVTRDRERH